MLEVNDSDLVLQWWTGTYTGIWRALTKRKGRTSEPWKETVSKSCILHQVSFTQGSKLPKSTQEKLHKVYDPLLAEIVDE